MSKNITLKKATDFFDNYILLVLSTLLLVVIPLYPKLPLFDVIPGYIVRVRVEDFLILFTVFIYLIQLVRKKTSLKTSITIPIAIYAIIGLLSIISGIYLTGTIPSTQVHLLKSSFHYLRYLEYFSLFFIFYSSIKQRKDLKVVITTMILSFILVGIYGIGQKYFYWPVYSTMNREFSKGIRLYLTEHARVQSTFGGHYDMAAYLVILLPMVLMLTEVAKKRYAKIGLWLAYILGTWTLVMSAARTSFAAAIAGIAVSILLLSLKKKKTSQKIKFFVTKSLIAGLIFISTLLIFGDDLSERLVQGVSNYPLISQTYVVISEGVETTINYIEDSVASIGIKPEVNIEVPENSLSTDQAAVIVASDTRPTPIKPSDVFVDVPDQVKVASVSATGEKTMVIIEVPRTYSENALKHGLSLAIRLDTLWPQALNGFYTNPVLGTGYATLTKSQVNEFTEADSTDNNFLRTLGETGALGFIIFYGIIFISLYKAFKIAFDRRSSNLKAVFAIAYIGSSVGLLINAVFIDVYAASKVAFTFWSLTGVLFALTNIKEINHSNNFLTKDVKKKRTRKKKWQFKNTPKK